MFRIALLCLAFAGCAGTSKTYARNDIASDHRQEAVKRMQDEFNRATGDAY